MRSLKKQAQLEEENEAISEPKGAPSLRDQAEHEDFLKCTQKELLVMESKLED